MGENGNKWFPIGAIFASRFEFKLGKIVLFTGTYQRSLDDKGRVMLPKRMRALLKDCQSIYLTPGTDSCLQLHTAESLNQLARKISQSASSSKTVQSFSRLFYAQAQQIEVDSQGRVRIPSELIKRVSLSREISIIGVGYHWELWDHEKWTLYFHKELAEFDWNHQSTFENQPIEPTEERSSIRPK